VTTALDRPPEEAAEDTSFGRGLRVFLTIADRGEIRADELSTLLETPLSTIYRYLRTLTEFGFVERQGTAYRLGSRLHVLGAGIAVSAEELIRAAEPVLTSLVESTGETAFISRRIGVGVVCLAQVPSPRSLRVVCEQDQPEPLHVGGVGKLLLAFAPPEVQEAALLDVPAPADIRETLAAIEADGAAQDDGETFAGVTTLAVPIMAADGIVAAIGVAAPNERASRRWQARTRGALRRAATELQASLG
jgi:IclR family transcriptional regulator, acetate operon repressor